MKIDHIAIPSPDIAREVRFYVERFGATVLYQDPTWAFLQFENVKLALVTPSQHPPHVAFEVSADELAREAQSAGKAIDRHRDRSAGIYLADPAGNAVELICYPDRD